MKKSFLFIFLAMLLTSCGVASHNVAEFEVQQDFADDVAEGIANYLADFAEIKNCNVIIDGNVAVIGLDLTQEHDDNSLIALKQRIVSEVKAHHNSITRVAVTTTPDMYEKFFGDGEVEKELEKNVDKEIFVNIVPTA